MNKNFHVDCYRCEVNHHLNCNHLLFVHFQDCQCSLSNEQTTAVLGGCCPLEDGTLLCYRCRIRRAGTSDN